MKLNQLFEKLWADYTAFNPSAGKILELFNNEGETVENDHIAFRTLNDPRIDIDVIARTFLKHGYQPSGNYDFKDKHLFAKHYELENSENAPRIFISQLILEDVSPFIRDTFRKELDKTSDNMLNNDELIFSGNIFSPLSYEVYSQMRAESEYAAWFYVFGFRANHFTVSVNALTRNNSLEKVNQLLIENGFVLNTSGGAIKGSAHDLLRQSSTMADIVRIQFEEGIFDIPCCYYEFAQRYKNPDGKLFSGFIAQSADKIFESTNNYVAGKS
jgi:hypothetical protein